MPAKKTARKPRKKPLRPTLSRRLAEIREACIQLEGLLMHARKWTATTVDGSVWHVPSVLLVSSTVDRTLNLAAEIIAKATEDRRGKR